MNQVRERKNVSVLGVPLAMLLWVFGATAAMGQGHGSDGVPTGLTAAQVRFLDEAQRATARYLRVEHAIADGFQPVGADAPAMGRHWLNIPRLFDESIEPAKPEVLMYASVDGVDSLVGISFAYAVAPGYQASAPENPFRPDAWHLHSGRLELESHRTDHVGHGLPAAGAAAHGHGDRAGVMVLHVWGWVENPAGVLEPNNWVLPYTRLGLSRPQYATAEADRALSLASDGAAFFAARAVLFPELAKSKAAGLAAAD